MWLNRLFTQIFLVFALVMIVCLGVSGWFVIQFSGNIVTRKICDGDRNFAGRIAQEIEAEVASVKPTLTLLAQTPELRLMEATKVSVGVDRVQRAFPEISSVYVADMEGKQIYRTGTGQLENVSGMRSFQVAKAGDKFSSDIYLKPTTLEPMQTITLPIIKSQMVVGVLSADVSFRRIMRPFMGVSVGEDGNVIVVADDGRVIAHTHIEQVQGVDLSRLPVVKAVLAGEAGTMKGYTDELGREVLGTYMPISELGWGVLIQRPLSNMYAEVGQLRTAIIWLIIAGVLLVLPAGWLMSRQIARPIGQIASASKRVAQGDLSTSVDVKSSNEVGLLAHSFNQMVMSLKKAKDELQQWGEDLEQSRNALRESEEKFREMSASAQDGIIMMDNEGNISFWNKAAERIFGYSAQEAMGKELYTLLAPQRYHNNYREGFSKFKTTGQRPVIGETLELEALKKDGTEFPIELSISATKIKGKWHGIGILRDISERKRLEKELFQAQKMEAIGTLAGGIAHDFNNILGSILGYTELSMLEVPEGSKLKQKLTEVFNAGKRAETLIQQILAFSRKQELKQKPLQLKYIVKESVKLLRSTLPTDIEIKEDIAKDVGVVNADPTQMQQVIMNLCINAGHAMQEEGGILAVGLANVELDDIAAAQYLDMSPGPYLKLSVSDTGYGMVPDVKERIFEPFFTTKAPGEGTGLGLSVVHGIVKSHGGTITVYSEPGKGSTFHVYLPLIQEEAIKPEMDEQAPILTGNERILFIDDEQALADLGKQMLERLGYEVTIKTSSLEALELFRNNPDQFDLVITDTTMPKMTGDKLAKELMKIRPDIPIIICTGHSERISEEKAIRMGIKAFAMKPLMMRNVANTVRKVLEGEKEKPAEGLILVIDDDDQLRGMLRQTLERVGYDVADAPNGKEGIRLFRENPADLVITDIIMPEKEGMETIIDLRREFPEVKIIAMSGGGRIGPEDYLQDAKVFGAQCTLTKPLNRNELLEAVRELINE